MIVLNLVCEHAHAFEGWFATAAAFEAQQRAALVACPMCDSRRIDRRPTAPRLNLSGAEPAPPQAKATNAAIGPSHWMQAIDELIEQTEDVGERFAEEARRIHYGESLGRSIRGVATHAEADALRDEGIEILHLPVPQRLKKPLQ